MLKSLERVPCSFLVAADLDQPLVADAEVMCDLVQHDVPDLAPQHLRVPSIKPFQRTAVDRDLVRHRTGVAAPPPRERHALIQAKKRLTIWRLGLQHDLDVGDTVAQLAWERIKPVLNGLLEVWSDAIVHVHEPSQQQRVCRAWREARWRSSRVCSSSYAQEAPTAPHER